MKHTLNFSLKLERHEQCVVYDEENFVEKPIQITLPSISEIIERFIQAFEEVGIIEQPSNKQEPTSNKKKTRDDISLQEQSPDSSVLKLSALRGLSGKAYICQPKDLDELVLNQLCVDLTQYFQECCSQVSSENLFSNDINLYISGLREIIEVRNYITRYVANKKKNYQNGYLYIVSL